MTSCASGGGGDCAVAIARGGPQQTTPRRAGAHARNHVAAQQCDGRSNDQRQRVAGRRPTTYDAAASGNGRCSATDDTTAHRGTRAGPHDGAWRRGKRNCHMSTTPPQPARRWRSSATVNLAWCAERAKALHVGTLHRRAVRCSQHARRYRVAHLPPRQK